MTWRGEELEQAGEAVLAAGRAWFELLGRASGAANGRGDAAAAPSARAQESSAILGVLAETQIAFLSAGLGYGLQLAELHARRAGRIAEPLIGALGDGGLDEADRRAVIEEARGYLREAAGVALTEARTFARALEEIDQRLHVQAGGTDQAAPSKRRWRAKD